MSSHEPLWDMFKIDCVDSSLFHLKEPTEAHLQVDDDLEHDQVVLTLQALQDFFYTAAEGRKGFQLNGFSIITEISQPLRHSTRTKQIQLSYI